MQDEEDWITDNEGELAMDFIAKNSDRETEFWDFCHLEYHDRHCIEPDE